MPGIDLTEAASFLSGTIRLAAPLTLAALGETIVQRSGVINIGIEGGMLAAAFAGFAAASASGSAIAGLIAAVAAGMAVSALFAAMCVSGKADQIVAGTGINIGMLGLTGALNRSLFALHGAAAAPGLPVVTLGPLASLPLVGKPLFAQSALVYLGGFVAIGCWFHLRSRFGLALRACGANPDAADAAGIRVDAVRWGAVLFGGAMTGLAGAFLTLVQSNTFTENMTSGRGFIALAVVIFGRWNPIGVLFAALVFGGANQMQFWMQASGSTVAVMGLKLNIPYQALLAAPYVVTLVVLAVYSGRYRGPAAMGRPFVRNR